MPLRLLDAPLPALAHRTPREIAFLGIVAACSIITFGYWPEFFTTAGVGLLFAMRVPQARPIAVGFCLGWLVSVSAMMGPQAWEPTNLRLLLPAVALFVLSSRDLFERFDAAPPKLIPNVWRELPSRHWRAMRWCAYSLGILVALTIPGWLWPAQSFQVDTTAPLLIVSGVSLSLFLLVVGQATGFLLAGLTAGFVLYQLVPTLLCEGQASVVWPSMHAPLCAAAAAVLLLSLPYCLRLFRR